MPRKLPSNPDTFTLLDRVLRAKADAFIVWWNAENPTKTPLILATFLRNAIRGELAAGSRRDEAILDAALLADLDAHVKKINASHPDDPYELTRFVRVTLRKAMRAGSPVTLSPKRMAPGG